MAGLENTLASVPGLGGYLARREMIEGEGDRALRQAGSYMTLQGQAQQQQQRQLEMQQQFAVRDIMARSGGDLETAIPALMRAGPLGMEAAGKLAQFAEMQTKLGEAKKRQAFMQPGNLAQFRDPGTPERWTGDPSSLDQMLHPAQPGRMNPDRLLAGAAEAGVIDPIAYAKEARADEKPIFAPRNSPGYYQNGQWVSTPVAEAPPRPMVEHNMPVGDGTKVQPHISRDGGVTWTPVPGSVPSPKFAKQVAPTFINGDNSSNWTNVQPDGKGGWTGLNKRTNRMEQIPTAEGITARDNTKPLTAIAKLNADRDAGRITPEQYAAEMAKRTGEGIEKLSDEAIEQGAQRYAVDGTLPPNMGRGVQGATNTARILNRASQIAQESGQSGEEARIRQLAGRAGSIALGQLVKQKNLILAFENTASRNADIALQQSEITDRPTEKPAIDRWLQAGKKQLAGDVQVAKLDLAVKSFANEYARVVTTVTGGGITSDTARREIDSMINSAQTKEQLRAVIAIAKQEMHNRKLGYEAQEKEIKNGFRAPKPGSTGAKAEDFFK